MLYEKKRGEITVFLMLMMTVLASFVLALDRSAGRYSAETEAECAMDNAVRSCFAEYNRELFDRYHILLVDSSYKGEYGAADNVEDHFSGYMEGSMTGSGLSGAFITGERSAAEDGGKYLYDAAVRYERSICPGNADAYSDDEMFRSYVTGVFSDMNAPSDGCVRSGEIEYLIYGADSDAENISLAVSGYESSEDTEYGEFLRRRLEEEDIPALVLRAGELITEYMTENGSPGFDLSTCYWALSFEAGVKSGSGDEYTLTREYGYPI